MYHSEYVSLMFRFCFSAFPRQVSYVLNTKPERENMQLAPNSFMLESVNVLHRRVDDFYITNSKVRLGLLFQSNHCVGGYLCYIVPHCA